MCEWGTTERMIASGRLIDVDSCIAGLVYALNEGGIQTVASCCGHGKCLGSIVLADGRELRIAPDYDTARELDAFKLYKTEAP